MSRCWRRLKCLYNPPLGLSRNTCPIVRRLVVLRGSHTARDSPSGSSLLSDEAEKFSKLSGRWWDQHGDFKALHTMNTVRIPFIRDCLIYEGYSEASSTAKPLEGLDVLDVGCGGGILSEPLARLGANVVAIDASEEAISAAISHRPNGLDNLQYLSALAEDLVTVGSLKFDAVIASEVVEHVSDQPSFIATCSKLLKSRGSLIISTVNRTLLSRILAVTAAESIMNVVPVGTHDWNMFVTVSELTEYLQHNRLSTRKIHGILYNPFCNNWSFTESTAMNYIIHATKNEETT